MMLPVLVRDFVDSGERVFISIDGAPTASITVRRLVIAGLIPLTTVWQLTPAKVGGYDAYVSCFMRMFSINEMKRRRPLEAILEMCFCDVLRLNRRAGGFANWKQIRRLRNKWKTLCDVISVETCFHARSCYPVLHDGVLMVFFT